MRRLYTLLVLFLFTAFSCTYNLTISELELNRKLQQNFPVEKEVYLSKIKLDNPKLKLLGNNKGEIAFDLTLKPPIGKNIRGTIDAIGKFKFNPGTKTLYLVDLKVEKVTINRTNILTESIKNLVSIVFKSLLKEVPVYRFKGEKARFIKNVNVEKGKVVITLGM